VTSSGLLPALLCGVLSLCFLLGVVELPAGCVLYWALPRGCSSNRSSGCSEVRSLPCLLFSLVRSLLLAVVLRPLVSRESPAFASRSHAVRAGFAAWRAGLVQPCESVLLPISEMSVRDAWSLAWRGRVRSFVPFSGDTWAVWSCAPGRADVLYADGLSAGDADLVATECNLVADELGECVEFRVAPSSVPF
jgi:hypothetical protein